MINSKLRIKLLKKKVINKYLLGDGCLQISKIYGVNQTTINRWLKRWGIKIRSNSEAVHLRKSNKFLWTKKQKEIINGELLGDGCITKNNKQRKLMDYYFVLNNISKEHCLKTKRLLPYGLFNDNTPYLLKNEGYQKNKVYSLLSRTSPYLTEQRKRWYPNEKKIVPKDLILTPTVLYHWYIGDGGMTTKAIMLGTDNFIKEDVFFLRDKMCKLGFKTSAIRCYTNWRIRIWKHHRQKFLDFLPKNDILDYSHKFTIR